jgi:hypothetical protein
MNQEIHKQLGRLKTISPNPTFASQTRLAVLSQKQKLSYWDVFTSIIQKPVVVVSFASLFLIIIVTSLLSPTPTISSLKNPEELNNEIDALSINIHLKEISYQQNADSMIMAAITEIRDTKTGHLNADTLESESKSLDNTNTNKDDINKLLETVIF